MYNENQARSLSSIMNKWQMPLKKCKTWHWVLIQYILFEACH